MVAAGVVAERRTSWNSSIRLISDRRTSDRSTERRRGSREAWRRAPAGGPAGGGGAGARAAGARSHQIPGAQGRRGPGAGHLLPQTRPEEIAAAVTAALAGA